MGASIEIPFAIGTVLWWPGNGYQEKTITCPECVGTKAATITLGNGESYSVACQCCSLGYDPPRGVVKINYTEYEPRRFECASVEAAGSDGFRYHDVAGFSAYVADLFTDEAACRAVCERKNEENRIYLFEGQVRCRREDARRKMAWSVHYWRSQRAKLVKDLADIERRLGEIKERKP